jgi:hypothetical protein
MSNSNTIEKLDQQFIVNGAKVIATLDIGKKTKEGDAEITAVSLLGIHYESLVAWQDVLQPALAADPLLQTLRGVPERSNEYRARKRQIVTEMVEHYLLTR